MPAEWPFLEPDVERIVAAEPRPLERLAAGAVAAIVVRQALSREDAAGLVDLLVDQRLMFRSGDERIGQAALSATVYDKYLGTGLNPDGTTRRRIDIGASLGNFGDDPDTFFRLANEANDLFDRLFARRPSPIRLLYETLARLSAGRRVVTAYEPDGRRYSPAIFRVHYGGFTYGPHFDSVRNRERRSNYAVHRFPHQFAGVLCLQNAARNAASAQCVLHRAFWSEEVDAPLKAGRFHEFARERSIQNVRVDLEPGDLYFFNTGLIHEVPGVDGEQPRVVLATFLGFGPDDPEIMVWS
ncbi:MAG: hypothetical protein KY476_01930 [Planctomycetes bacterium]|nr:hypothetical protein [Planctomycetota bacterium]